MSKSKYTEKKRKELRRVRSFIRRAEKRGYKFDAAFKSSLSSKSTRALQLMTPRRLYERGTYETPGGKVRTGLQQRFYEREAAAQRARVTREIRRGGAGSFEYVPVVNDIVYANVLSVIDEMPSSDGSRYLKNLLNSEIATYGKDAVVNSMNNSPELFVKMAQEIVYYSLTSNQLHEALRSFSEIIRGGIVLTKEESKELSEISESMIDI